MKTGRGKLQLTSFNFPLPFDNFALSCLIAKIIMLINVHVLLYPSIMLLPLVHLYNKILMWSNLHKWTLAWHLAVAKRLPGPPKCAVSWMRRSQKEVGHGAAGRIHWF